MKIKEIAEMIENDFSFHYAMEGDNVGLLVGDAEDEVSGILTTCDVDMLVVDEAIEKGINLIVCHHPVMFSPIQTLTEDNPEQKFIRKMIANGISLYVAHTNLDAGMGGINDLMAKMVGITDTETIDAVCTDEKGTHGFGRAGFLKDAITLKELMDRIIEVFGADGLRYAGNLDTKVKKIAVNTGGGASVLNMCTELSCDVLITGDIKYNGYRDALDRGMCVIDIMHHDSENIAKKWFVDYLDRKGVTVPMYMSGANINVVRTYIK